MDKVILIASALFQVVAQTFMKIGSASTPKDGSIIDIALAYIKSPYVVLAFGISGVAAFMWTYALSKMDLSYAYFVGSLSYIFVLLISIFWFHEVISPTKIVGCTFIMVGVVFFMRG